MATRLHQINLIMALFGSCTGSLTTVHDHLCAWDPSNGYDWVDQDQITTTWFQSSGLAMIFFLYYIFFIKCAFSFGPFAICVLFVFFICFCIEPQSQHLFLYCQPLCFDYTLPVICFLFFSFISYLFNL